MNGGADQRLRDVVIVGGGTAGWMAAAAYGRFLNNGHTRVTLIESDAIGTVGVGEATIPTILGFNQMLGIDEAAFLRATGGTFKLGIEFSDWGAVGDRYLHPFSSYGQPLQGVQFHHIREKLARLGRAGPLEEYSLCAAAAARGRFAHRAGDSRSPFSRPVYAYHFDAGHYARFLRDYAERLGVQRIEGRIEEVEQDGQSGFVTAVRLSDDRRVAGDLFLDCSGFRALLLGRTLGVGFEDWSHWLPCNRAVAVPSEATARPRPYTQAFARPAGWQWRIPLQHRTGNGHVYCDAYMTPDEAEATLLETLETKATAPPRHLAFTAGRRERFWEKNVVAIGLSSGFLEPLESTSIHLIQTGISKLMALMPDRRFAAIERDTYNRLMRRTVDGVRDFIILHYAATQRDDTPFWNRLRTMELPDSLAEKIALFRDKGRFFRYDDELFDLSNWVAVMVGQNWTPQGYDPITDALDEDRLAAALEQMRRIIRDNAAQMPLHGDYVRDFCAAGR
ncbi:tryptophan halogenase family protein [Stakelama saccharophila]|uniref:Tryptophan halogenase family protein n=1 Tax=Stakelama saccharophila TaxID=3075605 RepID=A0ABZ0B4P1_9SPHN|nr:tryptophan halogenase family protein [Stakelama sp. W311]WNO52356.1 tryptophan halogenase family protein [Stakelama sp. W311]